MDYWTLKLFHVLPIIVSVYSQEVFNTMPPPVNTSFTCRGRDTGFYADVETNCRVYHTCDDHGNKFTYYCPEETAFRQEALVCDHARLVDCAKENRSNDADDKPSTKSPHGESSFNDGRIASGRSFDVRKSGNSDPSYTRSFRITAEPSSEFSTPSKSSNGKPATFVLNSSVFLRDRGNFQKAPPIGKDDRAANVGGSTDFSKIRGNKNDGNNEEFFGQLTSSTLATTSKPSGADFDGKMDFRGRYFGGGAGKDGFSGRFSSEGRAPTRRPFGEDSKGDFGNAMGSRFSKVDGKDATVGFSDRSSSVDFSKTTFDPSKRDFKVEPTRGSPSNFEIRNSNAKDESAKRFSSENSPTTFRPFGTNFKGPESSGDVPTFGNVEFDEGTAGSGTRMASGNSDRAETIPKKVFRFDDKRRNDEKSEFRSFGSATKNGGTFVGFGNSQTDGTSRNPQSFDKKDERPSFFADNDNFPYSETLRSMQTRTEKSFSTKIIFAPTMHAGTEFPVHAFNGALSPLIPNELEDDPYYPKRSTTTEAYYRLNEREKGAKRPFGFSTRNPWPGSLDFEIPEVLPDLNTLDDLVDRRKLFFIPRVRAT